MCGILFSSLPTIEADCFKAALARMNHRGPDARAITRHGRAWLGHVRLKIQDLDDRSNQPFYSRDRRYVIIFNGEIYNYRELVREHGLEMRTTCDTEVIIELFARIGARTVSLLNGMFAFVILNLENGEIFAARDRLGVKPLYHYESRNGDVFSSEIASLLELTGDLPRDDVGVRQFRKLRTFFNGRTLYAGVAMFPAGCYLESGKVIRYWSLPGYEQAPPTDEELRALVEDSVRMRLVSDVPVGSYLSGGLDSTLVAALAKEPHTWTVGFKQNNEFEWGRLAAARIGSIHHEVLIEPEEFVEIARQMVKQRREPLSVPNEVLLFKMTREVKTHNTVVLSGEGADELFFGYDRIFRWAESAKSWDVREFARHYAYGTQDDIEIVEDAVQPFLRYGKPIAITAAFFQCAHLHGLLRRVDNATMLCAVEARVPFVDHHPLVERMAGVPFEYRMANGIVKEPLKRVFRDVVPVEVVKRSKVGFPVPLASIPWPAPSALSPMDAWLEFNLSLLN